MSMLEGEARTKWCPFSRVAFGHMGTGNRVDKSYCTPGSDDRKWMDTKSDLCRCIGNDCMAWRWGSALGSGYCALMSEPS